MQRFPSVCVMIPTYNQAGFITKAVQSALEQDYPNLQVLVADDNSTDDTASVLAPFIDQGKIQYFKSPHNRGRVANYRHCLYEHATADWVLNLDGDDYFTNPSFLSEAINAINKLEQSEVLFYQGVHIFKTPQQEKIYPTNVQNEQAIEAGAYFLRFFQLRHFSHMSTLYNRQAALNSGFYEIDAISADIYSFIKLALNNPGKKVVLSNIVSGVWLQHGDNASKNIGFKKYWTNFRLYSQLYTLALQKGYNRWACQRWRLSALTESTRMYVGAMLRRFAPKR